MPLVFFGGIGGIKLNSYSLSDIPEAPLIVVSKKSESDHHRYKKTFALVHKILENNEQMCYHIRVNLIALPNNPEGNMTKILPLVYYI